MRLTTYLQTFDAIALTPSDDSSLPHPTLLYPKRISALLPIGGIFLITSCNFTEEELKTKFVSQENKLAYHDHIPRQVFEYAGGRGQTVSTVAFKKV